MVTSSEKTNTMNASSNARLKIVFEDLQSTLSDFVLKHDITPEEFQLAISTVADLVEAGDWPVAALTFFAFSVKVAEAGRAYQNPEKDGATPWLPVGPAYVEGAPVLERPYVLPMRPDEPGAPLIVSGQVRATDGTPVADAELDLWMTNNAGDYSGLTQERLKPLVIELDESLPKYNLRAKIRTDAQGRYEYRAIMPGEENLGIPPGGPLDRLYRALEIVEVRPLHIHTIVTAEGYHTLTTQSHFAGDPSIGNTSEPQSTPDATVFETRFHGDPSELQTAKIDVPYYTLTIDYVVRPNTAKV